MPRAERLRRAAGCALLVIVLAAFAGGLLLYGWRSGFGGSTSNDYIARWRDDPASRPALNTVGGVACPGAPFILPSSGLIGLLWGDPAAPYTLTRRHTGIDIFGAGEPGTVPVYAVYAGWLTRRPEWRSTVIIRHDDPLQPGRTLWSYYTHLASRDGSVDFIAPQFPPGTAEQPVTQGTLLGYQGEFAGAGAPILMHVHLSLVLDDGQGGFLNEALLVNTVDPSPYFGMVLDIGAQPPRPVRCPGA
ncbi:MAG: M23 family metallopeptidase [Anaerolineae bacterium]|nr:M23 family metallopeptidase [Anaerolineae bacterium]